MVFLTLAASILLGSGLAVVDQYFVDLFCIEPVIADLTITPFFTIG